MPRHVRGVCDVGDCDSLATWAYRDAEDGIYVEVCDEHAASFEEQFDSDYERVEHDSPYRDGVERRIPHDCGGERLVYELKPEDDETSGEYRVCDSCSYAMVIEHTGEKSMEVRYSSTNPGNG
ncbi:MAG: hypothetical protein SXQ77_07980 [Halobacteria archaeon]|nr:hypothetical protein [Halobacteria archaeon]